MAAKKKGEGGLFGYGQSQKGGKDMKLFPTMEDIMKKNNMKKKGR